MTEFIEIADQGEHPAIIAVHRIVRITQAQNVRPDGAAIAYDTGELSGTVVCFVMSPSYEELKRLLQPINATP